MPPAPPTFVPISPEEIEQGQRDMATIDPNYAPLGTPVGDIGPPRNIETIDASQSADGKTAILRMMTPIETRDALEHVNPLHGYNEELIRRLNDPQETEESVRQWAQTQGQDIPNLSDIFEHRGEQTRFGSGSIHNATPTETQWHQVRERAIREALEARGLTADHTTIANIAHGMFIRAPQRVIEGLAQLGLRGVAAAGLIDEVDANMAVDMIGADAAISDEAISRAPGASIGTVAGDAALTYGLPLGRVTRFGRAANAASTIARRAAVGAVSGALRPAANGDEQNINMVLGAVTTPLMIPIAERVFSYVGERGASAYMRIAGQGIGQRIRDANGQLTQFGQTLRRRLITSNPEVPEDLVDHTLDVIVRANPRTLPNERAIIPNALATDQNVPLTGGMRARDTGRIDAFEQSRQGQFGATPQANAEQRVRDIDESIINNVRDIGDGRTSAQASEDLGHGLDSADRAGAARRDALYDTLKSSNERIIDPEAVAGINDDFVNGLAGMGEADTLPPVVRGYMQRLRNLVDRGNARAPARGATEAGPGNRALPSPTRRLPGATGPAEPENVGHIRFGELWNLSREVNEAARSATGPDGVYLGRLRQSFNDFFANAPDEIFQSGSNGVAQTLREANSFNRAFMDTFAQRNARGRSGATITDKSGQAVERIVNQMRDRNNPPNLASVEEAVFGAARGMDTAGARQATSNIRRIVAAGGEDARQAIKALTVNRVVSQIVEGLTPQALKTGKLQTVVDDIVNHNRAMLDAAGWSQADVTRLRVNAYLASLKVVPSGAGNPTRSGRMARAAVGTIFRNRIAAALSGAGAGVAAGVSGFDPYTIAIIAAVAGGAKLTSMRIASRAISNRIGSRLTGAPTTVARRAAQTGAAALSRQITTGQSGDNE